MRDARRHKQRERRADAEEIADKPNHARSSRQIRGIAARPRRQTQAAAIRSLLNLPTHVATYVGKMRQRDPANRIRGKIMRRVVAGNATATADIAAPAPLSRPSRRGGREQRDRVGDAAGRLAAPFGVRQLLLVLGVGQIAEFDQHRRHVRRLQHLEAGGTVRIVDQADAWSKARRPATGRSASRSRASRAGSGRPGCPATSLVLVLDVDAGELVGQVFAVGQRLRLGVGRLVGDGVDGGAANALQR